MSLDVNIAAGEIAAVALSRLFLSLRLDKLQSGLLHLAIGQQPDQRFVVKIDNLDAVAPRIAKIAAERRLEF